EIVFSYTIVAKTEFAPCQVGANPNPTYQPQLLWFHRPCGGSKFRSPLLNRTGIAKIFRTAIAQLANNGMAHSIIKHRAIHPQPAQGALRRHRGPVLAAGRASQSGTDHIM